MAHDVSMDASALEVTKKDLEFKVKKNAAMLGRLRVSKGGLAWVPKDHEKEIRLGWSEFASLMEDREGRRTRLSLVSHANHPDPGEVMKIRVRIASRSPITSGPIEA